MATGTLERSARAAVTPSKGSAFVIQDVTMSAPRDDEVLVRVVAVGVCHTDLIVRDQYYEVPLPSVLGHEGSGIVEAVGSAVKTVKPGDHVVMTFMSCGHCHTCQRGMPAYCDDFYRGNLGGGYEDGSTATRDAQGGEVHDHFFGQSSFGTFAMGHYRNVIKVREDAPLELLGPLGCGIQTGAGAVLNAIKVTPGSRFAAFGVGAVGLSAIMAARIAGARQIIAVDMIPERLALAEELGATDTVLANAGDPVATVIELSGGGVDFAVECTSLPRVVRQAIDSLATRGTCGVVGSPALGTEASFDVNGVLVPGKTIRGVVEGDSIPEIFIPQLIEFHMQGRFPFDRMVRFYEFDQINEAVDDAEKGRTIKPILRMPR